MARSGGRHWTRPDLQILLKIEGAGHTTSPTGPGNRTATEYSSVMDCERLRETPIDR